VKRQRLKVSTTTFVVSVIRHQSLMLFPPPDGRVASIPQIPSNPSIPPTAPYGVRRPRPDRRPTLHENSER
jgi:hypothetical protein